MIIGLTGQIGSGKSTAAKIFASFGAIVLDADQIGRQVVDESPVLLRKLVKAFGATILKKDGRLNRKQLARHAFADEASRNRLNELVHPYLLRKLRQHIRVLRSQSHPLVVDAALLLNWGMDKEVDAVVVVYASRQIRLERASKSRFTRADVISRDKAQLPLTAYRKKADYLISNSGNRRELRRKLRLLWTRFMSETD